MVVWHASKLQQALKHLFWFVNREMQEGRATEVDFPLLPEWKDYQKDLESFEDIQILYD